MTHSAHKERAELLALLVSCACKCFRFGMRWWGCGLCRFLGRWVKWKVYVKVREHGEWGGGEWGILSVAGSPLRARRFESPLGLEQQ